MKLSELKFEDRTYFAFELSDKSRAWLFTQFPPEYSKVICHHVTIDFNLTAEKLANYQKTFTDSAEVVAVGHVRHDGVECFAIKINGSTDRPMGGCYHVTSSVEPPHKPVESNNLANLQNGMYDVLISPPIKLSGSFKLLKK